MAETTAAATNTAGPAAGTAAQQPSTAYREPSGWVGWIHLIGGIIVFLAGLGLFTGNILARIVAVVVAGMSLIANFLFIPAYPLWALTVITLDVLVIFAILAHGREMADRRVA